MTKVALGFRIRSGWAAAVVLSGPSSAPSLLHARRVELSDPAVPDSRQPFHAIDDTQDDLEPDESQIEKRIQVVRRVTAQSIGQLLTDCRKSGWTPARAGIVAGSLRDPSTIRSPHIRAHALEGRLFRIAIEEALRVHHLPCTVLEQKTAFETATSLIRSREEILKRTLASVGRRIEGPWRADEKLAALAAWVAISAE